MPAIPTLTAPGTGARGPGSGESVAVSDPGPRITDLEADSWRFCHFVWALEGSH
jgi:hypothetical protein